MNFTPSSAYRFLFSLLNDVQCVIVCGVNYGLAISALLGLKYKPITEDKTAKTPLPFAIYDFTEENLASKWSGHYKGLPLILDKAFGTKDRIPNFAHLAWSQVAQLQLNDGRTSYIDVDIPK